jgi:hypothetical protein
MRFDILYRGNVWIMSGSFNPIWDVFVLLDDNNNVASYNEQAEPPLHEGEAFNVYAPNLSHAWS